MSSPIYNRNQREFWSLLKWKAAAFRLQYTPLKFNMEPENGHLEEKIPLGNHDFRVPC